MKKIIPFILILLLLAGCGNQEPVTTTPSTTQAPTEAPTLEATLPQEPQYTVGLSLPEQSSWQEAATALENVLTSKDCRVEVRFAERDTVAQQTHIEELRALQVDCLVIAPIDSMALAPVLSDIGIPVIAWDRLLMDTDAVSCCVTFDYSAIGAAMGQGIVRELSLDTAAEEARSYTVEFLMGSADNHSALLLHKGLMEVLEPYLSNGVLDCRSGRVSFEDSCVQYGDANTAKFQCSTLIQRHYTQELRPDVIVAASDLIAHGCIQSLTELGCPQETWPLITGQGTGTTGLRRVVSGKQALTVWADTAPWIQSTADAVCALLAGQPLSYEHTLSNHMLQVPVLYHSAAEVHKNNIDALLIETGLFTLEELTE